jgi:hypothetical protein
MLWSVFKVQKCMFLAINQTCPLNSSVVGYNCNTLMSHSYHKVWSESTESGCFPDIMLEMETSVKRIFPEIAWWPKAAHP